MDYQTRQQIREIYKDGGVRFHDAPIDWYEHMTPIEFRVWEELQYYNLPFCPQYPVLGFFADFADPEKKIIIEADGKDWHDPEKDRVRDEKIAALGWKIFRLTGSECERFLSDPCEIKEGLEYGDLDEEQAERYLDRFYLETASGLVNAICYRHYKPVYIHSGRQESLIRKTLEQHRGYA